MGPKVSRLNQNEAVHHFDQASSRAAKPGRIFPSNISKEAPPPVEICVILSASPDWFTAAAESPPPTMVVAPLSATASAKPKVPLAKAGNSKTPIGPFQTTVPAPANFFLNSASVWGPISKIRQPAGTSHKGIVLTAASLAKASAKTISTGKTSFSPPEASSSFAVSMASSSTRESPN